MISLIDSLYSPPSSLSHKLEYFRCADVELETAFDEVMAGQGNPIRSTNKLPLYLQHEGHSQTVFGFEMDSEGHENLLIFDPAKSALSLLISS